MNTSTLIKLIPPKTIYYNYQVDMHKMYIRITTEKSRTIRLKHNYMRGLIADGIMSTRYVKSEENLTHPLSIRP